MATPAQNPQPLDANQKAGVLLAVSQLDMLISAFANAPERVKKAAVELKKSLKEWANV